MAPSPCLMFDEAGEHMSDLEAVGEAVTGGVIARTVEPSSGEGAGHTHESACLNCGTALAGDYCHACGQRAHVHRTLGAFWHDLLHGVLHFEGKIAHTLPLLAWKPGDLTRRYVDGQRARFVSPIALFLFSVFLMFAAISLLGGPFSVRGADSPQAQAEAQRDYERTRRDALTQIAALRKEKAALVGQGRATADVDRRLSNAQIGLELQESVFREALGTKSKDDPLDGMIEIDGADEIKLGWFDAAYRKAKSNPKLLLYKLQNTAYKFSWVLIPISAPFLWLLFLHRKRYRRFGAYDHTVFVTYSLAFMTLGFVALTLLGLAGLEGLSLGLALLVPPIHMFRQLRGAYGIGRWSALWRTIALLLFASIAAAIFMTLLLLVGVL